MKILIIDDDYYIVEDIRMNIDWDRLGIGEQYIAHNVSEGKKFLRQHPDLEIVLTDIEMPRENGFELIQWLHEQNRNPVILLLTSHERFDYAHSAIEMRVQDYLIKPVNLTEMEKVLETAVAESKRRKVYPELFQINREKENTGSTVDIIIDCIRRNLSSPDLNRQMISEFIHMNPDYISAVFSKKTGESLTSFILNERLKAAKVMLATTDYSLQEISYRTGFSTPSYFQTQFKKCTGITPKKYRIQERGK